ncbi:MAG: metallophosphoesterase [Myxococcales bacterium]|nr:metallophosphoesterase [Myxococcales bacterium]
MGDPLISWLHLSDIHLGHGDAGHGWDQALVLDALRRDLAAVVAMAGTTPDAILVTGDIAFSGGDRARTPAEYTAARTWLCAVARAVGLGPQRVFVVPGNHDIQRSADHDRAVGRLVRTVRSGAESLDAALGDPGDRRLLARRMARYLDFSARFGSQARQRGDVAPEDRLWWTHRAAWRGLDVRLVGLNTSLLCAGDDDHGNLRVGAEQLSSVLLNPCIEDDELVIVLSHHPFAGGWLADEKLVREWMRNRAHIHLSGHVHDADAEQIQRGAGGAFVDVVAGAVHGDRVPAGGHASHGYNFASIRRNARGDLVLRVLPRRWAEKTKAFRVDFENVPDGQTSFELMVREAPSSAPRFARGSCTIELESTGDDERAPALPTPALRGITAWSSLPSFEVASGEVARFLESHGWFSGQSVGNYVLGQPLGVGGTGVVFRAQHRSLKHTNALKLFYPLRGARQELARAVERAARGLKSLQHPGIVSLLDMGYLEVGDSTSVYLVMEPIEGDPLDVWSARLPEGNEAIRARITAALQIASALHAAHVCQFVGDFGVTETGVVHGDVKPSNILVRHRDAQPVLLDFMMPDLQRRVAAAWHAQQDLATAEDADDGDDVLTLCSTQQFGTPGYMPVEQALQGVVLPTSDVYALGRTLSDVFRLPWTSAATPLSRGLEELVHSMRATDPGARPQTMAQVCTRLRALLKLAP